MEETKITPEEAFYIEKANLEREITNRVKLFAGTYATNVDFSVSVNVELMVAEEGSVSDCRISGVSVKSNYSQK